MSVEIVLLLLLLLLLSAAEARQARENLVNSLVGAIATATSGGSGAATAAGARQIEVENNQLAQTATPPSWLSGFKLPGFKGETASKDAAAIVDPTTELDPSAKAGPLVTPNPGPAVIEALITATTPDWLRSLVTDAVTMAGYTPNQGSVGNMKAFLDGPGFGSDVQNSSQKTNYQYQGQSIYKATANIGDSINQGDLFYLDGLHKDHLEVFDGNGNFKQVVNLDGTLNSEKTDAGSGRKLKFK